MGFNTTVVIYNDALGYIEKDPEFGKRLAQAVQALWSHGHKPQDFFAASPEGGSSSAGVVIETHHADGNVFVRVGQNSGEVVADQSLEVERLKREVASTRKTLKAKHAKEAGELISLLSSALAHVPPGTDLEREIVEELEAWQ
jgi:hypothetical protein